MRASAVEDGLIRANSAAGLRIATPAAEHERDAAEGMKALTVEELTWLIAHVPKGWRRL